MVSRKIWVVLSVFAAIAFAIIAYFYVTTSGPQPLPAPSIPVATTAPRPSIAAQDAAQDLGPTPQQVIQGPKANATQLSSAPEIATPNASLQTTPSAPANSIGTPQLPAPPATSQAAAPAAQTALTAPAPVVIVQPAKPSTSVSLVSPSAPLPAPKPEASLPPPEPKAAATPSGKKQSTQVIIPLPSRKANP